MRVDGHALSGALGDDLLVVRRVRVVDLREETLEREVARLLASGVLLAEVAAHAPDAADLADLRTLVRIRAENVDCRRGGDELDDLLGADVDALPAADAQTLVDLGESVVH